MKPQTFLLSAAAILALALPACQQGTSAETEPMDARPTYALLGFESKEAWGMKLVAVGDCDVCHSPKMMTDRGPVIDPELRLSGHNEAFGIADLDRAKIEQNGYGATIAHMTSWVGPWGVSFSANLTPHETGIGNWTLEQFTRAFREGKFKGMEGGRELLPPMPWSAFAHLSDDEVEAIFLYLKTLKPVDNVVPAPMPPVSPPPAAS
jgi:hypothetical protein